MILTSCQAANILRINENTLNALAVSGRIPHIRLSTTNGHQYKFNTVDINNWLKQGPQLSTDNHAILERYKQQIQRKYPQALADIQNFNRHFVIPRRGKGYNLTKVTNKKIGFVYYVRYIENGKLVPTRWSTHTNNEQTAIEFAVANRERLLSEYRLRKSTTKTADKLYTILKKYYEKNSLYLKKDTLRGRTLCESTRSYYHKSIQNHWMPFLKKNNIKTIAEIDTPLMTKFQDYCLAKGHKPQTVNHRVSFIKNIFNYLLIRGQIKINPCASLVTLRVKEGDNKARGCYNINELKGVFNKRWSEDHLYLLCLIIYFTGMRNSEINRIQIKDIITINKCRFIHIPKSKTKYGERYVPLHEFVYAKLIRYIQKHKKRPEDPLLCQKNGKPFGRHYYQNANISLGMLVYKNKTLTREDIKKKLEEDNITYYSGRHFWKTLMNAHDLGEIEEYFMGHKVSNDVAKRYNHRDKQGQGKIVQKAREVFRIIDLRLLQKRQ